MDFQIFGVMMNPSVSVVVPVYNVEMYLKECLDSLINQTFKDIEIICVNDGSTDNSLNILNEYASRDERIKVFSKENSGPGSTRNYGIDNAQGEYLLFVDSDDWLDLDAIKILYETSKSQDLDLLIFLAEDYDDLQDKFYEEDYYNNSLLPNSFDETVFNHRDIQKYLFSIAVVPYNKLYRRSILEKYHIRFPENIFFEDNPFHYEVLLSSRKMSILRKHFVMRRRREDSITSDIDKKFLDVIEISNMVPDVFRKHNLFNEYVVQIVDFKLRYVSMWYDLIEEKFKPQYWELMHDDFLRIYNDKQQHNLFLNNLVDKYREFYLAALESNSYQELDMLLLSNQLDLKKKNHMNQIDKEKRRIYNRSRVLDSMEEDLLNKNAKLVGEIKRVESKEKILDIKNDNIERYFAEKKAYYDARERELVERQADFEKLILEKNALFDEKQASFESYVEEKEAYLDKREKELADKQSEFENLILKRQKELIEKEKQLSEREIRFNENMSRKNDMLYLKEMELLEIASNPSSNSRQNFANVGPKISIVIAAYDAEKCLKRCLESVSNQTLRNIEVVCVDCGSIDDSLKILNDYSKLDSRVKVHAQNNLNIAEAKRYGFEKSSGEYVMFLDASDCLKMDACESVYADAKLNNVDLLILSNDDIDLEGNVLSHNNMGSEMFNIQAAGCQQLYKRELLKGIDSFDEVPLFWEAALSSNSFKIDSNRCIDMDATSNNSFSIISDMNKIFDIFKRHDVDGQYGKELINYKIRSVKQSYYSFDESEKQDFWNMMQNDFSKIKEESIEDLTDENRDFYNKVIQSRSFKELEYLEKYGDSI